MKRFFPLLTASLIILNIAGCGSNDFDAGASSASSSFTQGDKNFLLKLFHSEYLWYDHVPDQVDLSAYTTPQSMIEALKYKAKDRWSFALSQEDYSHFLNQTGGGFGIGFDRNMRVKFVRIDAPAWGRIERGDTLLKINGQTATAGNLRYASRQLGTPAHFTLRRKGSTLELEVTPSAYHYHVSRDRVLPHGAKTVAYLRCDSFSSTLSSELADRFADISRKGSVDEIIVDLRYNGGGEVGQAVTMMDYLHSGDPGAVATHLAWNDRYRSRDRNYYLAATPRAHALNLPRVTFLVTRNSASASELVIDGLRPYVDQIITIGTRTNGKNVGMSGAVYGNYYYFLINFYVKNAAGNITPSEGIAPTCSAADDLDHALGDPDETMLSTALYYLDHGRCPSGASPRKTGSPLQQSPVWIDGQPVTTGMFLR
jgi:C-terminal processing protease CtpA/Prc